MGGAKDASLRVGSKAPDVSPMVEQLRKDVELEMNKCEDGNDNRAERGIDDDEMDEEKEEPAAG